MGTTLVAARFSPNKQRVYIGHVGDSRCYRLRAGKLRQLTDLDALSGNERKDVRMRRPDVAEASFLQRPFDGLRPVLLDQPEEETERRMGGNRIFHGIDRQATD